MAIQPLAEIPIDPLVASLPKAELHLHQEEGARFERVIARRQGRPSHNWAIQASFTSAERRKALMDRLDRWEAG